MYNFVLIRNRYNQTSWYLRLTMKDLETLLEVQGKVIASYANRFFADPHNIRDLKYSLEKNEVGRSMITHPFKLGPEYSNATMVALFKYNEILINKRGGWMTQCDTDSIIDEQKSREFKFPVIEKDDVGCIYISKYPAGNHFYLSSYVKTYLFSSDKFNTYEEAHAEALRFMPDNRIRWKDPETYAYNSLGD